MDHYVGFLEIGSIFSFLREVMMLYRYVVKKALFSHNCNPYQLITVHDNHQYN